MPFAIVPFLLLIVPIVEIGAFIAIGGQIGIGWTLLMILVTAIIGTAFLRHQGLGLINRVQKEMAEGRVPGQALGEGLMIVVAGILLLTPGFVTDALGFLLFVPQVRHVLWSFAASRITVSMPGGAQFGGTGFGGADPFGQGNRAEPYDIGDGPVIDLDADEYASGTPDPDSPWSEGDKPSRREG